MSDDRTTVARRILLVEDEPSLVRTLSDRLASEGYEVDAVGDADEALNLAVGGVFHPPVVPSQFQQSNW